jgi:hypothetical protein
MMNKNECRSRWRIMAETDKWLLLDINLVIFGDMYQADA